MNIERKKERFRLINDHFQNYKPYAIPKAQLVIADIPYNIGKNAYGSNPSWYVGGDNKNGESELAGKEFFDTDKNFRTSEFLHFCSTMMIKEPKEAGKAPAMIVFCEFEQQFYLINRAKEYGLNKYINLVFRKNFSAQVLKANMRIVGNCEYGLVLYRDKLPKFRNDGKMVFNCIDWEKDTTTPKIHPCLPAGQKVWANEEWMNVEDVKIGDKTRYGIVCDTTSHYAKKIVEISTCGKTVKSTYNHPFLVKRDGDVLWLEAEQITEKDYLLMSLKQLKKDTCGLKEDRNIKCSMSKNMKRILKASQKVFRFITKISLKQTIELKTSLLLTPLHTSGCTVVARFGMESGSSHVKLAENIKNALKIIGTLAGGGLTGESAERAILKGNRKKEMFVLNKVESVVIREEQTIVHNLSIKGIPAFDTLIGVSHNTQKPVSVLERLIQVFTDPGDVVIDPVAGSGSTLLAAMNTGRKAFGFEIKKDFFRESTELLQSRSDELDDIKKFGCPVGKLRQSNMTIFDAMERV